MERGRLWPKGMPRRERAGEPIAVGARRPLTSAHCLLSPPFLSMPLEAFDVELKSLRSFLIKRRLNPKNLGFMQL